MLADTQLRRNNAVSSLVDEILNEVSIDESEEYCQQYYQSRVRKVLDKLEDIRANIDKILMRRVFKNWIGRTLLDRICSYNYAHESSIQQCSAVNAHY